MANRVYVVALSHPAAAGAAMVRHKRLPHRVVRLMPGLHPQLVRIAGFPGRTVPALELDGRKVQGSLAISRALDLAEPRRPLFPAEPVARGRVEEAEAWGEAELQPVPRRLVRFALLVDADLRAWVAREAMRLPLPALVGELSRPLLRRLADRVQAEEPQARRDLERTPLLLDRVDTLIAEGVIGGPEANAADFQLLSSVRLLLEFDAVSQLVAGRPCEAAARRLYPSWLGPVPTGPALGSLLT